MPMHPAFDETKLHRRLTASAYNVACGRGVMTVEDRNKLSALLHEASRACGGTEIAVVCAEAIAVVSGGQLTDQPNKEPGHRRD